MLKIPQVYGYTEAVEGFGVDIEPGDATSFAKRNTKCISGLTDDSKTFSELLPLGLSLFSKTDC